MGNKQIALTKEQMHKLQDLGLDTRDASMLLVTHKKYSQKSNRYYKVKFLTPVKYYEREKDEEDEIIYTYTLQDILEKLPTGVEVTRVYYSGVRGCNTFYKVDSIGLSIDKQVPLCPDMVNKSILETAYYALCWCLEEGYTEVEKNGILIKGK